MNFKLTRLHILDKPHNLSRNYRTGVSLHCHTHDSREMLNFVPHYASKIPIISYFWKRESEAYRQRNNKEMEISTSYWTPPLSAKQVYNLETQQINSIGLDALVSITDHDDIQAGQKVRREISADEHKAAETAPVSMEWTVPFEYGFFHVGVHNLPVERAEELTKELTDFSFAEKRGLTFGANRLDELFALLQEIPQVLIVLNHPLWDIELVGKERHAVLLDAFLAKHGRWIHAFEINGFRSWSENKGVLDMAETLGFPVVSGGDRHGCQPNSVVNLTTSNTFDEFVEQIRHDRVSSVAVMPHYLEPLNWRQLQSFGEILADFPDDAGNRNSWQERVFASVNEHGMQPLSFHWEDGGPIWLKLATKTLAFLGSHHAKHLFRLRSSKKDVVPRELFYVPERDEQLDTSDLPQNSTERLSL